MSNLAILLTVMAVLAALGLATLGYACCCASGWASRVEEERDE